MGVHLSKVIMEVSIVDNTIALPACLQAFLTDMKVQLSTIHF